MSIYILGFETKYTRDGKPVDWVHYAQSADLQAATTWARVKDITPREAETDDQVLWRWNAVGPAYEAWQQGNEIPETGTPLAAWATLSGEQAAALKAAGLRTVEDVAEMTDTIIGRVRLPNARLLKDAAGKFLDARGTAELADRLAALEAQNAELLAMVEAQPKRGRPRKTDEEVAA